MEETVQSINSNAGILLSRNTPVALVVGACTFLGSHLIEKLLDKNLQVVGVGSLKAGNREFLETAVKNKDFHLINNLEKFPGINFSRVDYLFIVPEKGMDLDGILKTFKETKCRCLLISNIVLYEKEEKGYGWLKDIEIKIAKYAQLNALNARVLRLGAVFGPRMDFRENDPVNKLIEAALKQELQKEVNLDFSTRALYVDDAIELVVKSMLSGSTALKIFDGVQISPIKISEIKQVLLDPVWYENKGFIPTELPPWQTPNLEKTIKLLNWRPGTNLIDALKKTLNYFKSHEVILDEVTTKEEITQKIERKEAEPLVKIFEVKKDFTEKPKKGSSLQKIQAVKRYLLNFSAVCLVLYALIWPVVSLGWGVFSFKYNLSEAIKSLEEGDFESSIARIDLVGQGVEDSKKIIGDFEPLRKVSLFNSYFESIENLINLANSSQTSAKSTILGIQALYQGLKAVTGEITQSPAGYFQEAQIELAQADEGFSKIKALTENDDFKNTIPPFFRDRVAGLMDRVASYEDIVKKSRASAVLLPELIALEGKKNYLVLLQNNMELRPGGGFIGSYAKINFESGRLKKLEVNDVYTIDGALKLHVEPPKEIREDLGQKDWYLRDSNFEPDFPTSARWAQWFYNKETGERVDGVIALDVSAIENLLEVIGPLDLSDYNLKVTSQNLFEAAITHAEQGFFPGSQAKKTFLTALSVQVFNKVFFLPKQNWPGIVAALGKSLENKHLSLYLDSTKLFSYLTSQNWTGALPRGLDENGDAVVDFLAPVEANLGGNKANYYLKRNYKLETAISKDGEVSHVLKISYANQSPDNAWPGGVYKNRFRVYLPMGAIISRASWGDKDITKNITGFVDYGRSGFSMLLELNPKEQKELVVSYQLPKKLKFKDNLARYRLDIVKQAGTLKDPFEWKVSYPINYKIASGDNGIIAPQEQILTTDLSKDRSFELLFNKSL